MPPPAETDIAHTPPDGGWGWAVVFGAFISIGFSYAFPKSIAIFFKEIQDFFDTSYSSIAWVSSIMLAAMYGGGPLSSILVNRFGSRPVVIFGGLLCGLGMVSAAFCTSIFQLYLCAGLITGTLIDAFGDYKYMFIKCGSVMVLAGIFLFIMNYYNYRMLAKEEKERKKCEKGEEKEDGPKSTHTIPEKEDTTTLDEKQGGHETVPLKSEEEVLKNGANSTSEA